MRHGVQVLAPPRSPGLAREARTFIAIGAASTLAYMALYALLREETQPWIANAVALAVTAVGNTAANRRLTFGIDSRRGMARDHIGGLAAFAVALTLTTAAIAAARALDPHPSGAVDLVTVVGANVVASVVRFTLLRRWIRSGHTRGSLSRGHLEGSAA